MLRNVKPRQVFGEKSDADSQRLTDETSIPTRWVAPGELVIHSPSEDLHALSVA